MKEDNKQVREEKHTTTIEIINARLVKDDYDILINFLDRMNFNYTVNDQPTPQGEDKRFSLQEMKDAHTAGVIAGNKQVLCKPMVLQQQYFKEKFNIDI